MNKVSVIQNFIIIACRNKRLTHVNVVKRIFSNNSVITCIQYPLFGLLLISDFLWSDGEKSAQMKHLQGAILKY